MTTPSMPIRLSYEPADAVWGDKALLSTNADGMTIHLTAEGRLGAIARAGRKLDAQGIRRVQLAGDGWDLERCWSFWQGFRSPKGERSVVWPTLPASDREELDRRLKIVDWVRDTINMPAEDLGPERLTSAPLTCFAAFPATPSVTTLSRVKRCASRLYGHSHRWARLQA